MNANEVLANRAAEILGGARGEYTLVHPNDHVNMGQSTNDVYPTATRVALLAMVAPLVASARALAEALEAKSVAFSHVLKTGRTHLQDAVPITLGQEFGGVEEALRRAGHTDRGTLRARRRAAANWKTWEPPPSAPASMPATITRARR